MNAPEQEGKWRKRINLAAATLFALILIGSLVVQLMNSNGSAGQTSPTPVPTTDRVNSTTGITKLEEIPDLSHKHGWLILATLHGIGNRTLNAQKLNLPEIWGTYLSCQGSGQASIQIQLLPDESIDTISCTNKTTKKPRIIIESFYGYTRELRISAGNQAHWRLQIMGCRASASTCGIPIKTPSKKSRPVDIAIKRACLCSNET